MPVVKHSSLNSCFYLYSPQNFTGRNKVLNSEGKEIPMKITAPKISMQFGGAVKWMEDTIHLRKLRESET